MSEQLRMRVRVRAFVKATGFTQESFAREARVSYRTVSKIANGHPVSPEMIEMVERALDRLEPVTEGGEVVPTVLLAELEQRLERMESALETVLGRLGDR